MKHLNQDQIAFLESSLFFALEANNIPKQRDVATAIKVVKLGTELLSVIGIEEYSDEYSEAVNVMDRVHLRWAE